MNLDDVAELSFVIFPSFVINRCALYMLMHPVINTSFIKYVFFAYVQSFLDNVSDGDIFTTELVEKNILIVLFN